MKRYSIIIIFVASMVFTLNLFAQSDVQGVNMKKTGQTSMNFLQVKVIPRAVALGDAYTAVGSGIHAVFYNPAGLADMDKQFEVILATTRWIADINYYVGGIAWNLEQLGTVGLSFVNVDYGDIIGTSLLAYDAAAADNLGYEETGLINNVGAFVFGLSYGRNISESFSMGLGIRYANQQLGQNVLADGLKDNTQGKLLLDLGVKYNTPIETFRFAMSMRNFSTQVKYEEISSYLPMTFAVGAAMDLMTIIQPDGDKENSLLATVEFTHPNNYTERVLMGLEYTFIGLLAVRAGYNTNHDVGGLSLGLGVNAEISGMMGDISYSYSSMDLFSDVHRFSFLFSF